MNKIASLLLVAAATLFTFTSCSDDKDDAPVRSNPEQEASGDYLGSFERVTKGQTDYTTAEGVISLQATETECVATLTFTCTEMSVNFTVPVNISYANDGFVFSNLSSDTELKAPLSGRIDSAGNLGVSFTLQQRSGRKTVQYDFVFSGNR